VRDAGLSSAPAATTAIDQHWTHNSDDSLSTLGRCLDIDGDGTAVGTVLQIYTCNGTAAQQFALS
jgi:non-reducing end alpha-L-arabinofuranosidase